MEVSKIYALWKKRSRPSAIREHCVECSGGSAQDVTICGIVDCPLWGLRFGGKPGSPAFIKRMESAKERNPEEFKDAYAHLEE